MTKYNLNLQAKTISISKAFEEKMLEVGSEEANLLIHLRGICPDLIIAKLTNKTSNRKPNPAKGLTYTKMENYIRLYENSGELLNMFYKVRALSQVQKNKFQYVYSWFCSQFPNYTELPTFIDGKLYVTVVDVIELEEEIQLRQVA